MRTIVLFFADYTSFFFLSYSYTTHVITAVITNVLRMGPGIIYYIIITFIASGTAERVHSTAENPSKNGYYCGFSRRNKRKRVCGPHGTRILTLRLSVECVYYR